MCEAVLVLVLLGDNLRDGRLVVPLGTHALLCAAHRAPLRRRVAKGEVMPPRLLQLLHRDFYAEIGSRSGFASGLPRKSRVARGLPSRTWCENDVDRAPNETRGVASFCPELWEGAPGCEAKSPNRCCWRWQSQTSLRRSTAGFFTASARRPPESRAMAAPTAALATVATRTWTCAPSRSAVGAAARVATPRVPVPRALRSSEGRRRQGER